MDKDWLKTAQEITTGDRRRDYGRPLRNFTEIGLAETLQFKKKLRPGAIFNPMDVAIWNIVQKVCRHINTYKDDNFVDIIGYSSCVNQMDGHLIELGYPEGVASLDAMTFEELQVLLAKIEQST